eukprot:7533235-Alexandrium_andersonii.AAC.1
MPMPPHDPGTTLGRSASTRSVAQFACCSDVVQPLSRAGQKASRARAANRQCAALCPSVATAISSAAAAAAAEP